MRVDGKVYRLESSYDDVISTVADILPMRLKHFNSDGRNMKTPRELC